MSELEDRLNAVLSDPQQLQRLTQMASQLMGGLAPGGDASGDAGNAGNTANNESPGNNAPAVTEGLADLLGGGALPAMLSRVMQNMQPGKKSPLPEALAPYLNDERRAKLERSLRIASAARMATSAFRGMGGAHGL